MLMLVNTRLPERPLCSYLETQRAGCKFIETLHFVLLAADHDSRESSKTEGQSSGSCENYALLGLQRTGKNLADNSI